MKTLSAFLWVALPKVIAGGGQFALNLFLIRRFEPEQFGALSVCLTAILLFDSFLGSAIDMAILRLCPTLAASGSAGRSLAIQKAGLVLKPLAITVIAIPLFLFRSELSAALLHRPDLGYLITLTTLALVTMLVLRSVQTYFQVSQRFQWYGGVDLTNNLLRYGFVTYAAAAGFASAGLVLATYALTPLLVSALLLALPAGELLTARFDWAATKQILKVLAWFVPAAAVGGLTSRMDVFFVAHLAGVREAGVYTAAQTVGIPMLLLGTYLSVVFGPRIMTQVEDGTLKPFYRRFQINITLAAISVYLVLVITKTWFSGLLFPPKFKASADVLLVLFPSYLAGLISFPLTISLILFLKPRFMFLFDACAIPLLCAAYLWVTPRFGSFGTAVLTTMYSLIKLGTLQLVAWRLLTHKDEAPDTQMAHKFELREGC